MLCEGLAKILQRLCEHYVKVPNKNMSIMFGFIPLCFVMLPAVFLNPVIFWGRRLRSHSKQLLLFLLFGSLHRPHVAFDLLIPAIFLERRCASRTSRRHCERSVKTSQGPPLQRRPAKDMATMIGFILYCFCSTHVPFMYLVCFITLS